MGHRETRPPRLRGRPRAARRQIYARVPKPSAALREAKERLRRPAAERDLRDLRRTDARGRATTNDCHSFQLTFGRAIISPQGFERWMLLLKHSRNTRVEVTLKRPFAAQARGPQRVDEGLPPRHDRRFGRRFPESPRATSGVGASLRLPMVESFEAMLGKGRERPRSRADVRRTQSPRST